MKIWMIENDKAQPVTVDAFAQEQCYLILDPDKKKILVWAGTQCPKLKLYKAGTLATKLKSTERLYGYEIQNLERGIDPSDFLSNIEEPAEIISVAPRKGARAAKPAKKAARMATVHSKSDSTIDPMMSIKSDIANIKDLLQKIWDKVQNL